LCYVENRYSALNVPLGVPFTKEAVMRLKKTIYYYCAYGKADIEKIRHYCSKRECPNLRMRPRKKRAK
jgi:hypothetical protein